MITIQSSSLFYNRFTNQSGGGVRYLSQNVGSRVLRMTHCYAAWNLLAARLQFNAEDQTITILNNEDYRTFYSQEFKVDDLITIVDAGSNNGDFLITDISEDGKTITIYETLVDATAESASIHGVTPITSIDYSYNIVPNDSPETYVSLVDPSSVQRYTASSLDATNTTPVSMRVATRSFAWLTNIVTDTSTGELEDCLIQGSGIENYRQYFTIAHRFYVTPFYLAGQYLNFANDAPPLYYENSASVKYICRVDGFFEKGTPVADHTGAELSTKGTGSWYDRASRGGIPEYSIGETTYEDAVTSDVLDALDTVKPVTVTIAFESRTGQFTETTEIVLGFFANRAADAIDTPTTMLQNLFHDEVFEMVDEAPAVGINFGNDYGSITGAEFSFDSPNEITVTFLFTPGPALTSYWQGLSDGQRYYTFTLETQDSEITTTKACDAVTARTPFMSAAWDKTDTSLLTFPGTGIEAFEFPSVGTAPSGSISGFEGDPWHTSCIFRIKKTPNDNGDTPTLNSLTFQVLASKDGQEDFIFEQFVIETSRMKKMSGVQQISFNQDRQFITYTGDPTNEVAISRSALYDTETESGYTATYGLVLRFEDWISALNQFQFLGASGLTQPGIASDFEDITMRWADYQSDGWDMYFRMIWDISDANGNRITPFASQIPVEVLQANQTNWPGGTGPFTEERQYFTEDGSIELNAIDREAPTLVRFTFNGDFVLPADAVGYYGRAFVLPEGQAAYAVRSASSEIPSEEFSPWSPTETDPDADQSYANGNLRINIYPGEKIVLEGYFDSSIYGEDITVLNAYARIGAKYSTSS